MDCFAGEDDYSLLVGLDCLMVTSAERSGCGDTVLDSAFLVSFFFIVGYIYFNFIYPFLT